MVDWVDVEKAKEMQGRDGGGRRDRERGGSQGVTVQLRHDEVHRSTASGSFAEKSSGEKEMEDSDEVVGSTASFFTTEGEMEDGDEEMISSGAIGDTSTGEEMEDSDEVIDETSGEEEELMDRLAALRGDPV